MAPRLMSPRRTEQGQTLPLVVLCVVTLMVAAALSVDLGSLAASNRRLQGVADLAAIDGARELTGTACNVPTATAPTLYDGVSAAVVASALRNGFDLVGAKTLDVELGNVTRDPATGVPTFTSLPNLCSTPSAPDSVRVTAGDLTAFSFGKVIGQDGRTTDRAGIGTLEGLGSFSVGSALATFDSTRSALLNPILSQMLCRAPTPPCTLGLSAVSYNGLVNTNITLGALAEQLRLNGVLSVGTTSELLNTNLTIDQILGAAATLAGPTTVAGLALTGPLGIATTVTGTQTVKLLDLVSAELANGNEAADVAVNLFDLVTGTGAIANGTNAVTVSPVVSIPGVTSVTVNLSLVEQPIIIGNRPGATDQTKQLTMTVTPTLNLTNVAIAGLPLASVTGALPITIAAGKATGTLTGVRCGADKGIDTTVAVEAANISVGTNLTLSVAGGLASVNLAINGTGASTTVGTTPLSFAYPAEFGPGGTTHVGNTEVGLGNIAYGSTTVTVRLLFLTIGPVTVDASVLVGILKPVLEPVDLLVVKPLMEILGLDLGAADVTALSITCGVPTLGG